MSSEHAHFQGKSANQHIVERFSQGFVISQEPHGIELAGSLSSFLDSFKTASILTLILLIIFYFTPYPTSNTTLLLTFFTLALGLWQGARSTFLSASRLEKLHKLLEEERYEIKHHRDQEREELKALYNLKGFEEPLLSKVVDVLMADNDRLLKVMLEEELGLSLSTHEHPLKQGLSALLGSLCASLFVLFSYLYSPLVLPSITALTINSLASTYCAYLQGNQILPAAIWSLSISASITGILYIVLNSVQ